MDINYGIIATAAISKRFVGAVQSTNGKVVAVGSRSYDKAKKFADENHIPKAYGSYEEVYRDTLVNVVYIATINDQHITEIKKALQYNKHVLCEKPMGLNEKEVQEVFTLAKAKGLFIMEMQKSIFLPITNIVKEYINNHSLGALHQISMSASFEGPLASWMHEAHQGGVVYGSASYTFEYLDYLLKPCATTVQTLSTKEDTGTIKIVNMNIKMDDIIINSRISMEAPTENYAVFYFQKGRIEIGSYWKARDCDIYSGQGVNHISRPVDYEMKYELLHIEECLSKGMIESPIMTPDRTINCVRIVEEIIDSN